MVSEICQTFCQNKSYINKCISILAVVLEGQNAA